MGKEWLQSSPAEWGDLGVLASRRLSGSQHCPGSAEGNPNLEYIRHSTPRQTLKDITSWSGLTWTTVCSSPTQVKKDVKVL